ncbi:hypothetical protein BPAE_0098g00440 [Botrytis paeoniae]|uniref:Uncharacterized protein n=1 Tax=Botrytis paeoniae TaxID=278948 RepID=A0A4Z1FQ89_9HELO|nr:hypothetical protein BPAE_0098g00440 [Botrytis paeoniae]
MSGSNNYQHNPGGEISKREDGDRIDEFDTSSRVDSQIQVADLHAQIQSLTAQVTYWRNLYMQEIRSDSVPQSLGQQCDQSSQDQDITKHQVAQSSERRRSGASSQDQGIAKPQLLQQYDTSPHYQGIPHPHSPKQQQIDAPSPNLAMQLEVQPPPAVQSQQPIFNPHLKQGVPQNRETIQQQLLDCCRNNKPPSRYPKDFRNEEFWQFELRLAKNKKVEPRRPWSVEFSKKFQLNNLCYWESETFHKSVILDPAWENKRSPPPFQGDLIDLKHQDLVNLQGYPYWKSGERIGLRTT